MNTRRRTDAPAKYPAGAAGGASPVIEAADLIDADTDDAVRQEVRGNLGGEALDAHPLEAGYAHSCRSVEHIGRAVERSVR